MPVLRARQCQRILKQLALGSLRSIAVGQHIHIHVTVRQRRRLLNGLCDAAQGILSNYDTVDHDLDIVLELFVQIDGIIERAHLAVDAHAAKALRTQILEQLGILALASTNHRRQHKRATALPRRQHLIGDLVGRLTLDDTPALGTVRRAHASEQQAQVVINLSYGTNRRPGILGRRLLIDRHGRRQAVNRIQIRLIHLAQKLARIAGKALDIATLALGIDGIERQRTLTRTGKAGNDHELVARNRDIDIAQVVLTRTANNDRSIRHGSSLPPTHRITLSVSLAHSTRTGVRNTRIADL